MEGKRVVGCKVCLCCCRLCSLCLFDKLKVKAGRSCGRLEEMDFG